MSEDDDDAPVPVPIEPTLDLHPFAPRDIVSVVDEYITKIGRAHV